MQWTQVMLWEHLSATCASIIQKFLDILLLMIQPIAFTTHVGTVANDLMQAGHQTETSNVSGCTHDTAQSAYHALKL